MYACVCVCMRVVARARVRGCLRERRAARVYVILAANVTANDHARLNSCIIFHMELRHTFADVLYIAIDKK